jgi:hypothetical protein
MTRKKIIRLCYEVIEKESGNIERKEIILENYKDIVVALIAIAVIIFSATIFLLKVVTFS